MNYQKLLKVIKRHTWWEEKSPMVYQFVMYPLHCFVEQCRYFHPKYLTLSVFVSTPGDFFHELTPQDEKAKVYWYIYNQITRDPQYLVKKRRLSDFDKKFVDIALVFSRQARQLSNRQIWQSYKLFLKYYLDFTRYVVTPECVDVFTAYELESLVRKELPNIREGQVLEITRVMATPAHLSFMEQERQEILQIALGLYPRKRLLLRLKICDIDMHWQKALNVLSRRFYWTNNSYATVLRLSAEHFFAKVKEEVKYKSYKEITRELISLRTKVKRLSKTHRQLEKKYRFSRSLMQHFKLVQFFGEWIDERKTYMLRGNDCLNQYCLEIAKRFRLPVHDVRYYLPIDVKNLLLHGKKLGRKHIRGRQTLSVYFIEKKGQTAVPTVYYGQQARKIFHTIQSQFQLKKGVVAGQVASAPVKKFSGIVQVVKDVHKEKFVPGRILVASMTRPDFVPLLRKATAIVTDEGGLTCHAAIISRELKLPCIIGTKNATIEFRTGDKVTMDLQSGNIIKN
ncbi:MAG: PEP-utilizing enzyme [Patescibacteria group bacterium]